MNYLIMEDTSYKNPEIKKRIRYEQIVHTYKQIKTLSIINTPAIIITSYYFFGIVPNKSIYIWLTLIVLTAAIISAVVFALYKKVNPTQENVDVWSRVLTIAMCSRALSFGTAGFLLYVPDSIAHQFILTALILISVFLYMSTLTYHKPSFIYSAPLLSGPFIIHLFIEGRLEQVLLGVSVTFMVGAAYLLYNTFNKSLEEALYLRFEKDRLASELEEKKQQAEHANKAKSHFLAAASHDLRQPIHAQGLYVSELKYLVHDSKGLKVLHNLEKSIDTMRLLFNSLLDISKSFL